MGLVNNFYKRFYQNLETQKIFFSYYKQKFTYQDLKFFFLKFLKLLKVLKKNKKQLKICVLSEKNFNTYAAILSTILSNNICIPLDPDSPDNFLEDIIEQINPDIVLIGEIKKKKIINYFKKKKIHTLKIKSINHYKISKKTLLKKNFPDQEDLAFIFFTSGSSGRPKGVKMTQLNYLSSLNGQIDRIYKNYKKKLVFGDYHNTSFVIILNILLPCLFLGSTISPAIKTSEKFFPLNHLKSNKINTLITLPSTINRMRLEVKKNELKNRFLILILCGEPFYFDLLKFIRSSFKPKKIFNCYGSTELSPWVFSYQFNQNDEEIIKKEGLVPIGKNFKSVKYNILKNNELIISGPMVNNYLNLKDDKISKLKDKNNVIWYKTRDIIKTRGKKVFVMGRNDSVVKVQGNRVELKGIESKIRLISSVKNCLVEYSKKSKKIIALIESSKRLKTNYMHKYLVDNLPHYMIPKTFIFTKKFQLNRSGKIDKNYLRKKYL